MKKFISLLGVFFLSTAGYAANKIEMVTYFPVPYVAYSRVQVDKILDIGLTNVCNMSLGCTESGNAGLRPLHVQDAYLETGSLDLTRALAVRSNNVSLGANAGEANIDFNDSLRIKNLNDGYSLETEHLTVDALKLFPNRIVNNFPSCAATGANGAPQVSWQKLKIKGKEETYLVCGTPKESAEATCSNTSYRAAHKEECCPCFDTSDSICYTHQSVRTVSSIQERPTVTMTVTNGENCGNFSIPDLWAYNIGEDSANYLLGFSYSGMDTSQTIKCSSNNLSSLEAECSAYASFDTSAFNKTGTATPTCYYPVNIQCTKTSDRVLKISGIYMRYSCTETMESQPNGWSGTGTCTQSL